jgi:hypothetical protein
MPETLSTRVASLYILEVKSVPQFDMDFRRKSMIRPPVARGDRQAAFSLPK